MSHLLLLATEVAETSETAPPEGMTGGTIAVLILIAALVAFAVAYFLVGPGKRRGPRRRGDIPLAMRPYHSDAELETTGLERAMSWGVALAAFCAVFLPLYWVIEPERINDKVDEFYLEDVAFGRDLYSQNCTTCHGNMAEGGFAPHPEPGVDAPWPAPPLDNISARYADTDIVSDIRDFIITTIKQGRPGTPMPAWGAAYNGPMNDQQVEAIADYILSIQDGEVDDVDAAAFVGASGQDLFGEHCARCHGYDAAGRVGPSLLNVFERYGATGDDAAGIEEAREAVRHAILGGRYVPTGAIMPPFADRLPEDAIRRIIDYLQAIQQQGGPTYGQMGVDTTPDSDEPPAAAGDEESQ